MHTDGLIFETVHQNVVATRARLDGAMASFAASVGSGAPGYAMAMFGDSVMSSQAEWQEWKNLQRRIECAIEYATKPDRPPADINEIALVYCDDLADEIIGQVCSGQSSSMFAAAIAHATQVGKRNALQSMRSKWSR
jgi:hypothetical protein